ncbi:hypothetical protein AGABI1DRAFT_116277 [Agaricus bisporus var. burnettii JB137-S8]|uniref:Caprin-1 dimerization domain-containing protein n=1 Tax=Agaricus bisporus var. burnettii (strain JB137-S8 / ATCC MYA-4627 / FGSC 10392) TaxID=597362 RepID=K5WXK5_AGABU|nr:uncharacterized protein AGABI1DRAFT_116277 [Agaricus bisporus var. burnettii JB137-S8]EKM75548.1 hypothetical protein AGABI1DRAFT_116277 [Agaricus bisporus var. burnettii JB137-S8]
MPESIAQPRIVPGAPPSTATSKPQRKKNKSKAKSDSPGDVKTPDATSSPLNEGAQDSEDHSQAQQSVRQDSQAPSVNGGDGPKHSPIVEFVGKRLKATTKKINRITPYAAMDGDKLDDDQKRILRTLPLLEAIQKELSEIKKAAEVQENELAQQLAAQRVEVENAEKARIRDAVAAAQSTLLSRADNPFKLLRIRNLLASNELDPSALSLEEAETAAIFSAADALLGEDLDLKETVIAGFLVQENDGDNFNGVSYSRLIEITNLSLNPPREPTPELEDVAVTVDEMPSTASVTGPSEHSGAVIGVPESIAASNSLQFMQDSELGGPFDDPPADVPQETLAAPEAIADPDISASVNGHVEVPVVAAPADTPATIDWAADETAEELPSIAGLHAEFGTSGSATPAEQPTHANGDANAPTTPARTEEDGFTPTGRGNRGGYRGDFRGRGGRGNRGYRGGFRGGYGQGGYGQGERDERGGDRGGARGHYRHRGGEDRGRGGYRGRGEYRGDGERRGGGRGRGRGDRGGPRPQGGPATPAPAPAAPSPAPVPNAAT